MKKNLITTIAAAVALLGAGAGWMALEMRAAHAQATPTAPHAGKAEMPQVAGPSAGTNDAATRGRYIATAADCIACHTAPESGKAFAGGYALQTPFGKLIASNITPDKATGIGDWSEAEFTRAVRQGKGRHGEHLYPAMPYSAYVKISDADMHDLWAYMQTVAPVKNTVVSNALSFPFNIRLLMFGWNMLFFDDTPFKADPKQSAEWNRGAYLVQGLEHCEACHTAKNFLGGDRGGKTMQGGALDGWYAPEVTGNAYVGVGSWAVPSLVQYLKTGANDISVAAGPMAEAVSNSTQHLRDADLQAMAVYLKSLPGSTQQKPAVVADDDAQMTLGRHVFEVNCAACHRSSGTGVPGMIPSLANNPSLQSADTTSLVRTVLLGDRAAITEHAPTGAGMPAFSWKLSDEQIAAVLSYTRNHWGNAAAKVTVETVKTARKDLNPPTLP
ncbi:MAG: c-type cytochrome [Janthinobacterium lividum]